VTLAGVDDPELPTLPESQLGWQSEEGTRMDAEYPQGVCLHELIAQQAQRAPNATVSDDSSSLSFAELDERASRLAFRLRGLGVGPDELVGVCMQRSTDLVVALLGILKAGGAFMPLEPDQPAQRLALMLRVANPKVVLTTAADRHALPPTEAQIFPLDSARHDWMSCTPFVAADCSPENLVYVMFTSGSTGTPKGVMVEHRSLVSHLAWRIRTFGLTSADRVLQKTPLGFDPALSELFGPLLSGASLTLLGPGDHIDPRRVAQAVRDERITVVGFVPSMLAEFVAVAQAAELRSLRLVSCGGETLTAALVRSFFERCGPDVELRNMYGPTETVLSVCSWRCDPASDGTVPIGRPVANTQIYLLETDLNPVPFGTEGELWVGGAQVARGYINQPGLTAERFVANPFRPGERMYRTGDVARHRKDGAIEFLGRTDDQVKIRGVRVEPGEIESVLNDHPEVRAAAVVARQVPSLGVSLVAYVVPRGSRRPAATELRSLLRGRLPESMVPAQYVYVDVLPTTANGKLDRRALLEQACEATSGEAATAPHTLVEHRLAELWARLLHVDQVGVDEDFFDLGGHSLLAVRMLREVEREFTVEVSFVEFFDRGLTVAGLAEVIAGRRWAAKMGALAAPNADATRPPLFFMYPSQSSMVTARHFVGPLGADQPLITLLPQRTGGRFDVDSSVSELAVDLVGQLRAIQPCGPYHLAGYSFGGLLAYEMAGLLGVADEEVAWLGLLGTATPQAAPRYYRWRERLARTLRRGPSGAARKASLVLRRNSRTLLVDLRLRRLHDDDDDYDYRGARRLTMGYRCRGHAAPLVLFLTRDQVVGTASHALGWETLHAGSLVVTEVPGDHLSMVQEPDVAILARLFADSLREAQSARPAAVP
jgi:amino acid adenylation domain-containing protein